MNLFWRIIRAVFNDEMMIEEIYTNLPIENRVEFAPWFFDLAYDLINNKDYKAADRLIPVLESICKISKYYAKDLRLIKSALSPPEMPLRDINDYEPPSSVRFGGNY